MNVRDYFDFIVNQIHTTVFATVDREGLPVTCAVDIMDYDESGLYFLTAKGKNLYDRLKANENVAFTAIKGESTLSCIAVSVQGKAEEIGPDKLPELFRKIPIWRKSTRMHIPAEHLRYLKSKKEQGNGLTCPNFLWNGPDSPSGARRQNRMGILLQADASAASCAIPNVRKNALISRRNLL